MSAFKQYNGKVFVDVMINQMWNRFYAFVPFWAPLNNVNSNMDHDKNTNIGLSTNNAQWHHWNLKYAAEK